MFEVLSFGIMVFIVTLFILAGIVDYYGKKAVAAARRTK